MDSVINQTWSDFEYIIIDGGSTDGSKEYLESKTKNITYWQSKPDKGVFNAMNMGIEKAKGEYLFFLNSGDYFLNAEILQKNINYLKDKDIIYFDIYYGSKNNINRLVTYPDNLRFYFFFINTICHQAVFFKHTLFIKYGLYDEDLKLASDWKFLVQAIIQCNASYYHVNKVCCFYDDEGMSSNKINAELLTKERLLVLNKEFPAFVKDYDEYQLLKFYFKKYKLDKLRGLFRSVKNYFKTLKSI